jgi:hypothetical protein
MELKEEMSAGSTKMEDPEDDNGTVYYRWHVTVTDINKIKVHCC